MKTNSSMTMTDMVMVPNQRNSTGWSGTISLNQNSRERPDVRVTFTRSERDIWFWSTSWITYGYGTESSSRAISTRPDFQYHSIFHPMTKNLITTRRRNKSKKHSSNQFNVRYKFVNNWTEYPIIVRYIFIIYINYSYFVLLLLLLYHLKLNYYATTIFGITFLFLFLY